MQVTSRCSLVLASAALVFTLRVAAQMPQSPSIQIREDNRTLSVSASDHAEADAEVADLHIGYTVYGMTLQDAYRAGSTSSNAILAAVVKAGAKRNDIQSGSQNVSRLSDYEIKQQKGAKFRVTQTWTVTLAPKDAAQVLDAAIQAGANESGDIDWRMKDHLALDVEAIRRATDRAHSLALELAKGTGSTLGKALYVTNNTSAEIIGPRPRVFDMAQAARAPAPAPLAVEPQRVQSEATVVIVYALQ